MSLIIFTVTPDDGEPFEVEAGSRDVARWEGSGRGRTLSSWQQNPNMTEMYRVCWIAMERLSLAGKFKLPPGVEDVVTLQELCDITSRTPEGLETAPGMGGGAFPPAR